MNNPARRCLVLLLTVVLISHPLLIFPALGQTEPEPSAEASPRSAYFAPSPVLAILPLMPVGILPAIHYHVLLPIDQFLVVVPVIWLSGYRTAIPASEPIQYDPPPP